VRTNAFHTLQRRGRSGRHCDQNRLGVDTLQLDARGLPDDTDFAVFLTSADAFATPPFGAVEYIGDFTTDARGRGSLKVDAIVAEAFVSTLVGTTRVRADLDHLVFWFAKPEQAQDECGLTTTTPFDGEWEGRTGSDVLAGEYRA
jgi:hypothetical protein